MKKAVAGYHILMILSAVDGKFNAREDMVIMNWMSRKFPLFLDTDAEMETLSALNPKDYMIHFTNCMNAFYKQSTEHERNELIQFAMDLVKADKKISREENIYLHELFSDWSEEED